VLDRLEPYDFLGVVIPGVLLAYWLPVCFPQTLAIVAVAGFPEAIELIGFAAVAIFFGHLIQAVASLLEPLLYRSWGGKPSERALGWGLGERYLSEAAGRRIRACLATHASEQASHQDLFRMAMTQANGTAGSRSQQFNALYAYHRALVIVVVVAALLVGASRFWGAAATWPDAQFWAVQVVLLGMAALVWHRAKQRAFHYVAETLHVAERATRASAAMPAEREGETG